LKQRDGTWNLYVNVTKLCTSPECKEVLAINYLEDRLSVGKWQQVSASMEMTQSAVIWNEISTIPASLMLDHDKLPFLNVLMAWGQKIPNSSRRE
jgi:hypothetical protein